MISDVIEEQVRITNFNPFPIHLELNYGFEADFSDIFDVRGYERERRGVIHPPAIDRRSMEFSYTGIDGRERSTRIQFDIAPERIDESSASFHIALQRRETTTLRISMVVDHHAPRRARTGSRIVAQNRCGSAANSNGNCGTYFQSQPHAKLAIVKIGTENVLSFP